MPEIEPITAAGGVVYEKSNDDDPKVLIIFRRKVWDLPKGKVEEGETVKECAVREVAEEIGLTHHPEISFTLRDTYHEYERAGKFYGKTTHWFGMRLKSEPSDGFSPQMDEGIEKVRWASLASAKERVGYDNLVEVLTAFERRYYK